MPSAPGRTIAIQHVHLILQGARRQRLPIDGLLLRAHIPPAILDSAFARVSQDQYGQLLRVLRHAMRDELWGLTSKPVRPGSFAFWAAQLVRCRTLGEAFQLGFALSRQAIEGFMPRLGRADDLARLRIVQDAGSPASTEHATRVYLSFAYGLASWLVAQRIPLVEVSYTAPPPGTESSRFYRAPIRWGQAHQGLTFEARWLELPVVQSTDSLREFLRKAPTNLLVRYSNAGTTADRIRRILLRQIGGEMPSLDQLAKQIGSTTPTLRRHLGAEGRSYQALKDDIRRDAAIELLSHTELTLVDIAHQLGFSEASAFQRAFKKWTGVAAGEYRYTRTNPK